jgi:hypothetical protein
VNTELVALATGALRAERVLRDGVVQGIAWQVKTLGDLGHSRSVSGPVPPADGAAQGCLVFDLALGRILVDDLSLALKGGATSLSARCTDVLSSFVAGLSRRCEEIRSELGLDQEDAASRLATAVRGQGGLSAYLGDAESGPAPTATTAPIVRVNRSASRRAVLVLSALLVLALVAHAALNWPSWLGKESEGVFELADFSQVQGVVELEDCPPSVLLTVREGTWWGLDGEGRRDLLDQTRSIVRSRGYQGVLLSTERGAVVGQWAPHSGIVVYDPE